MSMNPAVPARRFMPGERFEMGEQAGSPMARRRCIRGAGWVSAD
ncbi:MAG: hypothetical protein OEU94_08905 [Aquincola sp.]|nr:hypothetical protein [Aquincola sp.]